MDLNYFICTLGQAALPSIKQPFRDINHLIEEQALNHPELPAVGFYHANSEKDTYNCRILNFAQVRQGILTLANLLSTRVSIEKGRTLGLICSSSPAFLFSWLALIRLGYSVLLIAPQCSPSAIRHLCKACRTTILFYDDNHEALAGKAAAEGDESNFPALHPHRLPLCDDEAIFESTGKPVEPILVLPTVSPSDVAYLHHTSGTSSGIPKPIPQSHNGAVAALPSLDGSEAATFSTTPLYHGGIADLFRSWTSQALIWLFPAQHVPITAANISKCLRASRTASESGQTPPVRYFSSVPYVLQMMAEDERGLEWLQSMDLVGVGGAALPVETGDRLVESAVKLVSRYGSAECGFLMSSHREYANDKDWQYLRLDDRVKHLQFQTYPDQVSELIIKHGWPHMAKTNRDDGSFATSDLFASHPRIPNAWKYHSRADSQLTLVTGKKFDPAPLEGSLVASSPFLQDVLIFGNGQPYPGALLFRSESAAEVTDSDLIKKLSPIVERVNTESQTHARIPRNMLVPMVYTHVPLEKSSKGTVIRSKAEDQYSEHINGAYDKTTVSDQYVADQDVPHVVAEIVKSITVVSQDEQIQLTSETDLFSYGVDSVACVQIRHALTQLIPSGTKPLPLTIVQDSGTVSELSRLVVQLRKGEQYCNVRDGRQTIAQYVEQYSNFDSADATPSQQHPGDNGSNVLMTGPTGLLGAFILLQLLGNARVAKIYLLVRGATVYAARERIIKSLTSRRLQLPPDFDSKVVILPCKLSEPSLGISEADYTLLAEEVDVIFHLAWSVNFLVSLRSLASTHLSGLQNLLNLALRSQKPVPPQFFFCSSVASVSRLLDQQQQIPETVVDDSSVSGPTGYAQSKLAAELICARCADTTRLKNRITIIRVGQLSGDTQAGVWNTSEAYPLLLASSTATGVLPNLPNESLGWLPVDIAARSFIEAALQDYHHHHHSNPTTNGSTRNQDDLDIDPKSIQVLHLLNSSNESKFTDIPPILREAGHDFITVPPAEWLLKLEQLQHDHRTKYHPALKLLPFWRSAYGDDNNNIHSHSESQSQSQSQSPSTSDGERLPVSNGRLDVTSRHDNRGNIDGESRSGNGGGSGDGDGKVMESGYEMKMSLTRMPSLRSAIGPLHRDYVLKLWEWISENVWNEKQKKYETK